MQSAVALYAAAALAGILGSPHCIGMCGGFATACSDRFASATAWHLGKTLTYALLGAIAGAAGAFAPGPDWIVTVVSTALLIWFAAALAGFVPEPGVKVPWLARSGAALLSSKSPVSRFAFGAANGLLPCGLVYAALSLAITSGTAIGGATIMAVFGISTIPSLTAFALGLRKLAARSLLTRRLLALGVLAAGLWSIGMRQMVSR